MPDSHDNLPPVGVPRSPDTGRSTLRLTSQGKIVGKHPSIREVVSTVEQVASSNCTVLVTGESGTGKELVVAALHDASLRSKGPLVTVNCGTIQESLIESHLFGHVRGAYTGAVVSNQGVVASAEGGTLFFDEVGELPLLMQVKLLRLLQQREYIPVGDTKTVRCDIRVVAATNVDLEAAVAAGKFREDLYYRLNVVHVHLPPLRERDGDVELLAMHFLKTSTTRNGRVSPSGIEPTAMRTLRTYPWPGNIRELENAMERAVLLAPGAMITHADLPSKIRTWVPDPNPGVRTSIIPAPAPVPSPGPGPVPTVRPDALKYESDSVLPPPTPPPPPMPPINPVLPDEGIDLTLAMETFENSLIVQALRRTQNNKNRAAQLLRINRTTLIEKIRRKRLDV